MNCTHYGKSTPGDGMAGQCPQCAMISELIAELVQRQLREGHTPGVSHTVSSDTAVPRAAS